MHKRLMGLAAAAALGCAPSTLAAGSPPPRPRRDPAVALAIHAGVLYVGDLTGAIHGVKP